MSFEPQTTTLPPATPPTRRPQILLLALVLLLAPLAAGCGKKGDPLPPLRTVPIGTKDLEVRQQGRLILLELTYPATTSSGQTLGGIDSVELYKMEKPVLGEEPPTAEPAEFENAAELVRTLRGTELESAIVGDRIQIRLEPATSELAASEDEEKMASLFAVRTTKAFETSDFSNRVTLVPAEPPPPPTGLEVTARPGGVELRWQAEEAEGFDVFRRLATERGYGSPVRSVPGDQRRITDSSAQFGQRYIYTVRTITGSEPRVESELAGEVEIDYADTFAPRLPTNIVALPERGAVRLRWEPSPDADTVGYYIHRRDAGRDTFVRLNDEPLAATEYLDRGLASGLEFAYRLQAVDGEDNVSDLSPPVVATTR